MSLVLNGSTDTITGLQINSANIVDGSIVNADINDLAASKLTGALPAISGAALTGISGGKILQVVGNTQTYSSNISTTSTSPTVLATSLNTSITPSASSSKIFVIMTAPIFATNSFNGGIGDYYIGRNGTVINDFSYGSIYQNASGIHYQNLTMSVLDSPSTDQQVTYNFMCKTNSSSNSVGIGAYGANEVVSVTLFEVGA